MSFKYVLQNLTTDILSDITVKKDSDNICDFCLINGTQIHLRQVKSFMRPTCMCLVAQSYPTLCDLIDYISADSSVHGIFQARILEWVAIYFSRGSSWPKDETCISCASCIGGEYFTSLSHQDITNTDYQVMKSPDYIVLFYRDIIHKILPPSLKQAWNKILTASNMVRSTWLKKLIILFPFQPGFVWGYGYGAMDAFHL